MAYNLNNHTHILEAWHEAISSSTSQPPSFTIPVPDGEDPKPIHSAINNLINAIRKDPDFANGRYFQLQFLRVKRIAPLRKEIIKDPSTKEKREITLKKATSHLELTLKMAAPILDKARPSLFGNPIGTIIDEEGNEQVLITDEATYDLLKRIKKAYQSALDSTPDTEPLISFPFIMREDLTEPTTLAEFLSHLRKQIDETAGPAFDMKKKRVAYTKDSIGNFVYTIEVDNPNYTFEV